MPWLPRLAYTVLVATLSALPIQAQEGPSSWSPKAAAKFLDDRAEHWLTWSGANRGQGTVCTSCHTTLPYALARPALGDKLGEASASMVEQQLIDNIKKRVQNWDKIVADATEKSPFAAYYSGDRKPSALGTESVINAVVLVNHDVRWAKGRLSEPTKKALGHLWEQQQPNGAWLWLDFGLRPWEQMDSDYFGAALAALAVGTSGEAYQAQADVQPKVAALKIYLKKEFPSRPLHHRVMGLWASSQLPGILDDADKKQLIAELLKTQEADGGWSLAKLGQTSAGKDDWKTHGTHPEKAVSDGYATGLVVLALKRAGIGAENPNLKKALAWLVTHEKDGTWPTNYPNRPRDPQNNVGMFMRTAATAFAILALTE